MKMGGFSGEWGMEMGGGACKGEYIIYGPAAEKEDLRIYAKSEDTDQPAYPRSLVRIFADRLHNIGTL